MLNDMGKMLMMLGRKKQYKVYIQTILNQGAGRWWWFSL